MELPKTSEEALAKWREANADKVRARAARYNAANLERKHERKDAWRKANPEKARS